VAGYQTKDMERSKSVDETVNEPVEVDETNLINQLVLATHLNHLLFEDLFKVALKNLNVCFEEFKKTDDFMILREDINR